MTCRRPRRSGWRCHRFSLNRIVCSAIRSRSPQACRERVREFLADKAWTFPAFDRVKSSSLHRIFDPRRILADDPSRLKGSCSEFLGLFSLLRHWVLVEAPDHEELGPCKRSFAKLCDVMDLILHVKRGIVSPADGAARLAIGCREYLQLHKVGGLTASIVVRFLIATSCGFRLGSQIDEAASPLRCIPKHRGGIAAAFLT